MPDSDLFTGTHIYNLCTRIVAVRQPFRRIDTDTVRPV
jgi:hypothetical protein